MLANSCAELRRKSSDKSFRDGGSAGLYMTKFTDPLINSFRQQLFHSLGLVAII